MIDKYNAIKAKSPPKKAKNISTVSPIFENIKFRVWDKILCCFSLNSMAWNYNISEKTVSPETGNRYIFLRYIGLEDRNKKEIFVGDVYKWKGYEVRAGKQTRPERIGIVEDDIHCLEKIKNIIEGNGTLEVIGDVFKGWRDEQVNILKGEYGIWDIK